MAHTILNVDDFGPQRYARSAVLRAAGFEVIEAATGRNALSLVTECRPALVVLDVHLPDIDGFDVCRRLKADPATKNVPVLHVSATFVEPGARVEALDNGADAYLPEPLEPKELVAQVRSLLRLSTAESQARDALKALDESRELIRSFYDADGVLRCVTELDEDGVVYLRPNTALAAFHGMSVEEMSGKRERDLGLSEDVIREWVAIHRRCQAARRPLTVEVPFHTGNRAGWYHATISPILSSSALPARFAVTMVEITEGKQVERALAAALTEVQQREAEISSIYDSAPIGLCVFDREGRYLRVNKRLAEINGPPPEAHIGRTIREVVPGIADQAEELLRRVLETGAPLRGVELVGEVPQQPGGIGTWIENWHPIRDAAGAIVGVNVGVEDVTRLKQVENDLRAASQVKDDFLATLSHELRTPLSAILGWAQLLQRGGLNAATTRQALDAIARNAEAQRQLIADVLDVSRMVAGKFRLEMVPVDLVETLRAGVASMRPTADEKGVGLEFCCACANAIADVDQARIQQIVWNLLSNAVKFTPSGGRVTVTLRETGGGYELIVQDTGIGIRPEFLPHVFDRFAQADSSTTRRHAGLGLGLSIVHQLVELHGGRVSVASGGDGAGATFVVTLPPRKSEGVPASGAGSPTAEEMAPAPRLEGVRVLIVDDLEDARSLTGTIVEKAGGMVRVAASGEEALLRLSDDRPDVILADLAMPEMDGYEFLRRLRTLPPEAGGTVPAVALTAYGGADHQARSCAAGFCAHLTKPVASDVLLGTLEAVALGRAGQRKP